MSGTLDVLIESGSIRIYPRRETTKKKKKKTEVVSFMIVWCRRIVACMLMSVKQDLDEAFAILALRVFFMARFI